MDIPADSSVPAERHDPTTPEAVAALIRSKSFRERIAGYRALSLAPECAELLQEETVVPAIEAALDALMGFEHEPLTVRHVGRLLPHLANPKTSLRTRLDALLERVAVNDASGLVSQLASHLTARSPRLAERAADRLVDLFSKRIASFEDADQHAGPASPVDDTATEACRNALAAALSAADAAVRRAAELLEKTLDEYTEKLRVFSASQRRKQPPVASSSTSATHSGPSQAESCVETTLTLHRIPDESLFNDPGWRTRLSAVTALRDSCLALVSTSRQSAHVTVSSSVLPVLVSILKARLQDPNIHVATAAVEAAAASGVTVACTEILRLVLLRLRDKRPATKAAVQSAVYTSYVRCGAAGNSGVVGVIEEACRDVNPDVRAGAAECLGACFRSSAEDEGGAAAAALPRSSFETLVLLVSDQHAAVRAAAARVLSSQEEVWQRDMMLDEALAQKVSKILGRSARDEKKTGSNSRRGVSSITGLAKGDVAGKKATDGREPDKNSSVKRAEEGEGHSHKKTTTVSGDSGGSKIVSPTKITSFATKVVKRDSAITKDENRSLNIRTEPENAEDSNRNEPHRTLKDLCAKCCSCSPHLLRASLTALAQHPDLSSSFATVLRPIVPVLLKAYEGGLRAEPLAVLRKAPGGLLAAAVDVALAEAAGKRRQVVALLALLAELLKGSGEPSGAGGRDEGGGAAMTHTDAVNLGVRLRALRPAGVKERAALRDILAVVDRCLLQQPDDFQREEETRVLRNVGGSKEGAKSATSDGPAIAVLSENQSRDTMRKDAGEKIAFNYLQEHSDDTSLVDLVNGRNGDCSNISIPSNSKMSQPAVPNHSYQDVELEGNIFVSDAVAASSCSASTDFRSVFCEKLVDSLAENPGLSMLLLHQVDVRRFAGPLVALFVELSLPAPYFNSLILHCVAARHILSPAPARSLVEHLARNSREDEIEILDRIVPSTSLYRLLRSLVIEKGCETALSAAQRLVSAYSNTLPVIGRTSSKEGDRELFRERLLRHSDLLGLVSEPGEVEREPVSSQAHDSKCELEYRAAEEELLDALVESFDSETDLSRKEEGPAPADIITLCEQGESAREISFIERSLENISVSSTPVKKRTKTSSESTQSEHSSSQNTCRVLQMPSSKEKDKERTDYSVAAADIAATDIRLDRARDCHLPAGSFMSAAKNGDLSPATATEQKEERPKDTRDGALGFRQRSVAEDASFIDYSLVGSRGLREKSKDCRIPSAFLKKSQKRNDSSEDRSTGEMSDAAEKGNRGGANSGLSVLSDRQSCLLSSSPGADTNGMPIEGSRRDTVVPETSLGARTALESEGDNLSIGNHHQGIPAGHRKQSCSEQQISAADMSALLVAVTDAETSVSFAAIKRLAEAAFTDLSLLLPHGNRVAGALSITLFARLGDPETKDGVLRILMRLTQNERFCKTLHFDTLLSLNAGLLRIAEEEIGAIDVLINMCAGCSLDILRVYFKLLGEKSSGIKNNERTLTSTHGKEKESVMKLVWAHAKRLNYESKEIVRELVSIVGNFYEERRAMLVEGSAVLLRVAVAHLRRCVAAYSDGMRRITSGRAALVVDVILAGRDGSLDALRNCFR